MAAIFKSSLQNLAHEKPVLKLSPWLSLRPVSFPKSPQSNDNEIGLLKFITSKILCNIINIKHIDNIGPYVK